MDCVISNSPLLEQVVNPSSSSDYYISLCSLPSYSLPLTHSRFNFLWCFLYFHHHFISALSRSTHLFLILIRTSSLASHPFIALLLGLHSYHTQINVGKEAGTDSIVPICTSDSWASGYHSKCLPECLTPSSHPGLEIHSFGSRAILLYTASNTLCSCLCAIWNRSHIRLLPLIIDSSHPAFSLGPLPYWPPPPTIFCLLLCRQDLFPNKDVAIRVLCLPQRLWYVSSSLH